MDISDWFWLLYASKYKLRKSVRWKYYGGSKNFDHILKSCLWFLAKKKAQPGKTLFIDARKMGYMKDRTHRELSCGEETEDHGNDIARIAETFEQFRAGCLEPEKGYSAVQPRTVRTGSFLLSLSSLLSLLHFRTQVCMDEYLSQRSSRFRVLQQPE